MSVNYNIDCSCRKKDATKSILWESTVIFAYAVNLSLNHYFFEAQLISDLVINNTKGLDLRRRVIIAYQAQYFSGLPLDIGFSYCFLLL